MSEKSSISEMLGQEFREVKLADGTVYKLRPLTLNDMIAIEELVGKSVDKVTFSSMTEIRTMLWLMLKKDLTELTVEHTGDLITTKYLQSSEGVALFKAMSELNGGIVEASSSKN